MGSQRTTFGKLQRDRDKKAKAAAKRERRLERSAAPTEPVETVAVDDGTEPSPEQLLEMVAQIHRDYEAQRIGQEEFEERKAGLMSRLRID